MNGQYLIYTHTIYLCIFALAALKLAIVRVPIVKPLTLYVLRGLNYDIHSFQ